MSPDELSQIKSLVGKTVDQLTAEQQTLLEHFADTYSDYFSKLGLEHWQVLAFLNEPQNANVEEFLGLLQSTVEAETKTSITLLAREPLQELRDQQTQDTIQNTTLDGAIKHIAERRAFYELLVRNARRTQQSRVVSHLEKHPEILTLPLNQQQAAIDQIIGTDLQSEISTRYPKNQAYILSGNTHTNLQDTLKTIADQIATSSNPEVAAAFTNIPAEAIAEVATLIAAGAVSTDRHEVAAALYECTINPNRDPFIADEDTVNDPYSLLNEIPSKAESDRQLTTPENKDEILGRIAGLAAVKAVSPALSANFMAAIAGVEAVKVGDREVSLEENLGKLRTQSLPFQPAVDLTSPLITQNPSKAVTSDKPFIADINAEINHVIATDPNSGFVSPPPGNSTSDGAVSRAAGFVQGMRAVGSNTPNTGQAEDGVNTTKNKWDLTKMKEYAETHPDSAFGQKYRQYTSHFKKLEENLRAGGFKKSLYYKRLLKFKNTLIDDAPIIKSFKDSAFYKQMAASGYGGFLLDPLGSINHQVNFLIGKTASRFVDPFRKKARELALSTANKIVGDAGMKALSTAANSLSKGAIKRTVTEAVRGALLASGAFAWAAPFADAIVWLAEQAINLTFGLALKAFNSLWKQMFGKDFDKEDAAALGGAAIAVPVTGLAIVSGGIMAVLSAVTITFLSPVIFAIIIGSFFFFYIPTINIGPLLSTIAHLESGLGSSGVGGNQISVSFDPNVCDSHLAATSQEIQASMFRSPGYIYYQHSSLYPNFEFQGTFFCTAMIMKAYERSGGAFPQNLWSVMGQKSYFESQGKFVANGSVDVKKLPVGTAVIWSFYDRDGDGKAFEGHIAMLTENPPDQPFVNIVESNNVVTHRSLSIISGKLTDPESVGIQGFGLPPCASIGGL